MSAAGFTTSTSARGQVLGLSSRQKERSRKFGCGDGRHAGLAESGAVSAKRSISHVTQTLIANQIALTPISTLESSTRSSLIHSKEGLTWKVKSTYSARPHLYDSAMAKEKSKSSVPNKHLHSRISYIQQAATYLTVQARSSHSPEKTLSDRLRGNGIAQRPDDSGDIMHTEAATSPEMVGRSAQEACKTTFTPPAAGGLPMLLSSNLTQVARKSQIRLHPSVKHQMCRRCNAVLTSETSSKSVENLSKGGHKLYADVLVVECRTCGAKKRFPVGATRQKKKGQRIEDGG